jgi:hypothetical protein
VMGATLPSAASARTQMRFRAIASIVSYVSVPGAAGLVGAH